MSRFEEVADKCHRDPNYARVVDMMVAMAMDLQMSPGELREAAVFAEIKVMSLRPVRTIFPGLSDELIQAFNNGELK